MGVGNGRLALLLEQQSVKDVLAEALEVIISIYRDQGVDPEIRLDAVKLAISLLLPSAN